MKFNKKKYLLYLKHYNLKNTPINIIHYLLLLRGQLECMKLRKNRVEILTKK